MRPLPSSRISPAALAQGLVRNRQLLVQLVRREVAQRYRGSMLGMLWSLLTPLLMLAIYTFVFSVVFQARWGTAAPQSRADFALVLFVGLSVHALFAEVFGRAPTLIANHANYVKRVVFPLEILPVVITGSALFSFLTSLAIVLVAQLLLHGSIPLTALWLPLVLLPFMLFILGLAWLTAAVGVFLRDIGQIVALVITALMFLSPIFYSAQALPEALRPWLHLNPLTLIIEQSRGVLLWGAPPDWQALLPYSAAAALLCWCGFAFFQITRKGFADVL